MTPVVEQISIEETSASFAATKAWEIDGASDARRIAKHAIQAANRCVALFNPMSAFYHWQMLVKNFLQTKMPMASTYRRRVLL